MLAAPAWAHDAAGHAGWTLDAHLLIGLGLIGGVYASGVAVLWRRAGIGRGVAQWQAGAFASGWLVLVVALVSPLADLAEQLGSAHMVQHLLLMLVAAPLLVFGAPGFAALWALPPRWRQRFARWWRRDSGARGSFLALSQPLMAWLIYLVVLWAWHLPTLYEAALHNPLLHDLQHILFVAGAGLLWWVVLNPMGQIRLARGAGVIYLFATSMHAMALGVFMTLAPTAWYPTYETTAPAWGLAALEDQQIAGAIMWMPAALVYVSLAALIFVYWMKETETATARLESLAQTYEQKHQSLPWDLAETEAPP